MGEKITRIKILLLGIVYILIAVPASYGDVDGKYAECSSRFKPCTLPIEIGYPFWGDGLFRPQYCGRQGFSLDCSNDGYPQSLIGGTNYFRVLNIDDNQTMTLAFNGDLLIAGGVDCPSFLTWPEITINWTQFEYTDNVRILSIFFNCSGEFTSLGKNNFSCSSGAGLMTGFFVFDDDPSVYQNRSSSCNNVFKLPVQVDAFPYDYLMRGNLNEFLIKGFQLRYYADKEKCSACSASLGICGSDKSSQEFVCLCRDKPHSLSCPAAGKSHTLQLVIGLGSGITIACATICIIIINRKNIRRVLVTTCCRKATQSDKDLEAFIRNYGPLPLKRYKFSDVKKMTNSLKDKLGHGGFGGVYKGKLTDGRLVAVKILNASKGDGQDFINEVGSICRTSHVNIVTLLGFCLDGDKRALIYEFMPNGSLEKFIYNGDTSKPCTFLRWEKMCEIIIAIARGLEYLHRGCSARILHFDIKPHNILLDEDFCPKISDFGMAKLCTSKDGVVSSMLGAPGTIGYIAPEVFSRNFGEVSHKSDVYSFGMMIMNLVGCKNNLNSGLDNSSEIYFPQWIYRHFEQDREFYLPGVVNRNDNEIAKKMIIVGLWCIQARPSDRPPMNELLEMLQGSAGALQVPPAPFLDSPPRPPLDSHPHHNLLDDCISSFKSNK